MAIQSLKAAFSTDWRGVSMVTRSEPFITADTYIVTLFDKRRRITQFPWPPWLTIAAVSPTREWFKINGRLYRSGEESESRSARISQRDVRSTPLLCVKDTRVTRRSWKRTFFSCCCFFVFFYCSIVFEINIYKWRMITYCIHFLV